MATTTRTRQLEGGSQESSLARRVTVVHSGARDAYQVAMALEEAGMLDTLVTDLFLPSHGVWAQRLLSHLPSDLRSQLKSRTVQSIPFSKVSLCATYGLAALMLDKLPFVPKALGRYVMRQADANLGRTAGQHAERYQTALLSYSYYAYDAFRSYSGDGMLFQLHPHPASMRRILLHELSVNPQCAASLQQEWELALPEWDFQNLVREPLQARFILAASSFTRDTLVENGTPSEDIRVLPYGVDSKHFSPGSEGSTNVNNKLKLLFVGRINQRKGIQYLLDALRLVNSDRVELTVCGRVVDDLMIFHSCPNVIIRPDVTSSELVAAYRSADLFVFPSVAEGFGQVLLEALASGVPILSTTRTAAPDLIETGRQGFIVDPCNAEQLATHIEWALTHRQSLARMGAEARHTAEQFTWSRFRASVSATVAGFLEDANISYSQIRQNAGRADHAFEFLLALTAIIAIGGAVIAFDSNRDVFHPLIFIGPMLAFLYAWMPWKLYTTGGLAQFFADAQLIKVQTLFAISVLAFVVACLSAGVKKPKSTAQKWNANTSSKGTQFTSRILIGAGITGSMGLMCWAITIINVGGFVNAYSSSYSGGWDDSGYVRDGSLLLLTGILLALAAISAGASKLWSLVEVVVFSVPWLSQALLMARRGPTFAFVLVVLMGWYFNRKKRPPILAFAAVGVCLGWLVLFLVTNRGAIYLGSNFDVTTDVSDIVETPDNGNEYIYGAGTVIAAERRDHYFWMRRYLAQILVRPIPSAIWPTKYQDFGVPELLTNAGTAEGFADALGWAGAPGSAPGIAADLWVELWWLAVPAIGLLGYMYGKVWRNAVEHGGAWTGQYIILSALSIYLVMQTMEAVIFRTILLSIPCWLTWRWAVKALPMQRKELIYHRLRSVRPAKRSFGNV